MLKSLAQETEQFNPHCANVYPPPERLFPPDHAERDRVPRPTFKTLHAARQGGPSYFSSQRVVSAFDWSFCYKSM